MNVTIDADTRLRLAPHAVSHALDNSLALLDVNTGVYYTIDGAGVILGEMLGSGTSLGQIAQRVSQEYEVEPQDALADLIELADELLGEGLVVVDDY